VDRMVRGSSSHVRILTLKQVNQDRGARLDVPPRIERRPDVILRLTGRSAAGRSPDASRSTAQAIAGDGGRPLPGCRRASRTTPCASTRQSRSSFTAGSAPPAMRSRTARALTPSRSAASSTLMPASASSAHRLGRGEVPAGDRRQLSEDSSRSHREGPASRWSGALPFLEGRMPAPLATSALDPRSPGRYITGGGSGCPVSSTVLRLLRM
jgi:hypothetical protein